MTQKRKYTKTIKFYMSNVFGKWKPTTWIFFFLAIVGLLFSGKFIFNSGNIYFFGKHDNRVTYISNNFVPSKGYHEVNISFQITQEEKKFEDKINYGDVKFSLNNMNEYFVIPDYKPWGEYSFGYCNEKLTDCYIYDKYNSANYKDEDIYYEVIIKNFNPENNKIQDFWFEPTEYCPEQKITTLIFNIKETPELNKVLLIDKYGNTVYFKSLPSEQNVVYGLYNTETNETYIKPKFRCEKQLINTLARKRGSIYEYKKLQTPISCKDALLLIKDI